MRVGIGLLLILVLCGASVGAQTAAAPAFFVSEGVLWRWDVEADQFTRINASGYVQAIDLSPDGSLLAYNVQSEQDTSSGADGSIWLLDVASNESRQIVGGAGFYHSPTWSPDGSRLAWNQQHRLTIYALATGEIRSVADLPGGWGDGGLIAVARVSWGDGGIFTTDPFSGTSMIAGLNSWLRIYHPNGDLRYTAEVGSESLNHNYSRSPVWVNLPEGQNLAIPYADNEGFWELIPPFYDEPLPVSGVLVLVSAAYPGRAPLAALDAQYRRWLIASNGDRTLLEGFAPLAVSPDGSKLLYVTDHLYLWENDHSVAVVPQAVVPQTDVSQFTFGFNPPIVWGRSVWHFNDVQWIIRPEILPACPDGVASESAYRVGDTLRVERGSLLLYHEAAPFRLGDVFVPAGDTVTIEAGPFCPADNPFAPWWQMRYGSRVGWTTLDPIPPDALTVVNSR